MPYGIRLTGTRKRDVARFRRVARARPMFEVVGPCDRYWGEVADVYLIKEIETVSSPLDAKDGPLLPIADDGMGNLLALGMGGQRRAGAVFYVDHEYRPRHRQRVVQLATSLAMFCDKLVTEVPEDKSRPSDEDFMAVIEALAAAKPGKEFDRAFKREIAKRKRPG